MDLRGREQLGGDGVDPDNRKASEFDRERRALKVLVISSHAGKRVSKEQYAKQNVETLSTSKDTRDQGA